jgi:hypothetical protein
MSQVKPTYTITAAPRDVDSGGRKHADMQRGKVPYIRDGQSEGGGLTQGIEYICPARRRDIALSLHLEMWKEPKKRTEMCLCLLELHDFGPLLVHYGTLT